jgi:antirestriction protein ArdC
MAFDIYAAVTDRIIQQMENGVLPWSKPWGGISSGAYSGTTGKPYSLLNQMLLSKPGAYYTFLQIQKQGGSVRKGEKSQMVVFWKQIPVKEQNSQTGELQETLIPMLRYYNVFHVDQCEGISTANIPQEQPHSVEDADSIISAYLDCSGVALIQRISDEAYYSPSKDCVVLPVPEQFKSMEERYSTTFHELAHSTGHQSRLDRLRATVRFGNESYSKEELVAEITATALMNHTGLETKGTFRNSAAYIQNWLSALRNDKRLIVTASGAATKAFEYIIAAA